MNNNIPTNLWSEELKPFIRHSSKLSISHDTLIYNSIRPIIVVPFKIALDLALSLHYNFAHVGREKVLDLLSNLGWHPSNYKIARDVCSTCHQCQIQKEFSTPLIPPTLKIQTSYPFELMAADLVSLSRTPSGYIGC